AREVDIRSEVSGKIVKLDFEEGDVFKNGETLCLIDKEKPELQLKEAEAAAGGMAAKLALLQRGLRTEEVDKARIFVNELKEKRDLAKIEYDRAKDLLSRGVISKSAYDTAETALRVAQEQMRSAGREYEIAKEGYRKEEIKEAEEALKGAEAKIQQIQRDIKNSNIISPVAGVVTKKLAEQGEYIPVGGLIATVTDLDFVWLKIFISEEEYGKVKLGEKVKIKVDSYPDRVFQGKIIFISSEAEFTPKNIQTKEDRVKLVYAIKVGINNKEKIFKLGMPADAVIEDKK
ncbi:MAG: hypothetical protein A2149_07735, partial [Candidatus Schekmanbacteria bacterium RBG_16_38_11]